MNLTKIALFILLAMYVLSSCEEVITLDLNQTPSQLVIDGLITNEDTFHVVRLTRSIDFYSTGVENILQGVVSVSDNAGNTYNYTHNPEGLDSLNGYYFSDQKFSGTVNRVYQLNVTVDGFAYQAADTLRAVTTIDSLSIYLDEHAVNDPNHGDEIYQIVLYAEEPQGSVDFYYFKFYRDSVIDDGNNAIVFEDKLLGERLDGLRSPVRFEEGVYATVEIYSLTREQFIYFNDLSNILNSDGGMFSPPPANPRTNISGGALGLFQVSSVSRKSILVIP